MNKDPFKEYIKQTEPGKRDRGYAWNTAIGLQAVDGLKPSKYLIDTASYVNLRLATTNVQNLFLIFFVYLGQVGNCMFIACSAYFLLEQQTVKINKVLYFLGDCFFFSLTFLSVFLLTGWEIPKSLIFKQFFPITFESNWFIGCYLLLYIIHPALNLIIRNLSQKQLLLVDLAGLVLYSFLQMLVRDSFYYTRLVGFMLIYFLMAYCKQYLKRTFRNKKLNLLSYD